MLSLRTLLLAVAAALVVGLATGWIVQGWRKSGEVQELKGQVASKDQAIATLEGANKRCAVAVADVKGSVQALVDDSDKRSKAALQALLQAAKQAEGNLAAARDAMSRAMPPPGKECDAMVREALDYAKRRKAAP